LANVPQQLVVVGGGLGGGGSTKNVAFMNNTVSDTAGGINTGGLEQSKVTIDSKGATITGNTFSWNYDQQVCHPVTCTWPQHSHQR
jgi:hypothetical protein